LLAYARIRAALTIGGIMQPAGTVPVRSTRHQLSAEPLALLTGVQKSYQMDAVTVPVLQGIDLLIRPGHFTVLLGPSGSGKTTLLNLVGCIDRADHGGVTVAGQAVDKLSDDELADFRAENIGFIFQSFNLLPVLTAAENIEYPLVLAGMAKERRRRRVDRLLEAVGLADRGKNLPGQLSGGQRQRVAIARALARRPKLILADEPTANLDSRTGAAILKLMRQMQAQYQISFLFSSHDRSVIKEADDLIRLRDGVIQSIERKTDVADPGGGSRATKHE
jgi:putative ABC transport system ATP-binding protein